MSQCFNKTLQYNSVFTWPQYYVYKPKYKFLGEHNFCFKLKCFVSIKEAEELKELFYHKIIKGEKQGNHFSLKFRSSLYIN